MPFTPNIDELINLRHKLHQNPELSNQEEKTSQILKEFISQYGPDQIIENIGGHGLVAVFEGENEGKHIGIRADMDALPIDEYLDLDYASKTENVAHKCGHDGHMTMVAGLAQYLKENRPQYGSVYLVFQPAEETGEGAARVVKSLQKENIKLDYLFGLHNLPGFSKGQVVTKKDIFAAASKGMVIKLTGETSHAAEPENGKSPVIAISKIIAGMTNINKKYSFSSLTLATVIHTVMGEIAFGTTPGYGEVRVTLRSMKDADMKRLTELAEKMVKETAEDNRLKSEIDYVEIFPTTENSAEAFDIMQKAADSKDIDFKEIEKSFKWSEDFGHFKGITKTGFFGLGIGKEWPSLHSKEYDFQDAVIETGLKMYIGLIEQLTQDA